MGVDVGSDDETDDVEERHPRVLGEELLRKGKGQRRRDPADLHDGHEAGAHGSANLVDSARSGNNTHGGEVDSVLDRGDLHRWLAIRQSTGRGRGRGWPYDQVANEDLQDLGLETRPAGKEFLQNGHEEVAQRRGNEQTVQGHLGHAMTEVVAVFADIVSDPGRKEFLQGREDPRGQHLGAQGVRLELAQVELDSHGPGQRQSISLGGNAPSTNTYSHIPDLRLASRQAVSNAMRQLLGLMAHRRSGFLCQFDGHGVCGLCV